ncbi:MAG: B12-binding domain-containing radical SAM protein, partial [Candidatus Micrarchaeia archaeon]
MKTLLYNPPGFMREECCISEIPVKIIPSQIFLAGAYLQKQGFDVDVVDGQTQKEEFNDYDVVVVWVALFDGFYKDIEYLKKAKELGKKTVMVLNDPIEGMEKEAMERFDFIDVAVRLNEREVTLGKVLQAVQKGVILDFPGVMWREGKKIVDNGVSPFLPNLHHLGSCSQLLEKLPLKSYESAFIITGRGCPFQCTFCEYRQSGVRKRRIEDILSEFAVLDGKIERVFALDLNMPADKKWTNEFLEKMKESKFKVKWQTDARAGDCTIELLKKFKDAGCTNMVIGVESLDDGILEKIRKGTNVAMIK